MAAAGLLAGAGGCNDVATSFSDRPCTTSGECLSDYVCDETLWLCVGTGDPCGSDYREISCADDLVLRCEEGFWSDCGEPIPGDECTPGSVRCEPGERLVTCDEGGFIASSESCLPHGCNDAVSPARCNACLPGESSCEGETHVVCGADGTIASSEVCEGGTGCANVGACDAALGCQLLPEAPDGTPCDEGAGADGNLCNSACQSGVCTPGADPSCSDGNPCTRAVCEPDAGCDFPPIDAGTPCPGTNGDLCDSTCDGAGQCNDAVPIDCLDDNHCTLDTCDSGECLHVPGPAGITCRAAAGTCDLKEVCDGVTADCPPDLFQAAGFACGDVTDETCNGADACDGLGNCQAFLAPTGTACGRQGECAIGDTCDGLGLCTDNGALAAGTPCGDSAATTCSAPDTCDGDGACDPNHATNGALCGDDSDSECSDPDSCDGFGVCDPNHEGAGTPCGSNLADACSAPDSCDGFGVCAEHHAINGAPCDDLDACNAGENCQSGLCIAGDPPSCDDGGDCREDDFCDPSGDEGNCDTLGAGHHDGETCYDCPSGTCTVCGQGLCLAAGCDGSGAAVACSAEDCGAQPDCQEVAGDCRRIGCANLDIGTREHHACADAADAVSYGALLPCRSVNCSDEGGESSGQAIGADCFGKKTGIIGTGHATIAYVFATTSPTGTPFNLWMRNYRHTELDGSEAYGCSLTGVAGGTIVFSFDEGETGAGRHGAPCTTVTNGYCWMAIDGDADATTYDPLLLDSGEHTLSCDIGVRQDAFETDENYGYDGILFTNDLSFVPDPKNGTPCQDRDATFSAGTCSGVNWGPNASPYLIPGTCSAVLPEADGTPCWQAGGDTCCAGACVIGEPGPGDCG